MTEENDGIEDVERLTEKDHCKKDTDYEAEKNNKEEHTAEDDYSQKAARLAAEKRHAEEKAEQEAFRKDMARNLSDLLHSVLQQNPLPHFCVYITWVLLVVTMAACAFFLILYSMQWGSTTSEEWLASFFLSFLESFFLLDPLKVCFVIK